MATQELTNEVMPNKVGMPWRLASRSGLEEAKNAQFGRLASNKCIAIRNKCLPSSNNKNLILPSIHLLASPVALRLDTVWPLPPNKNNRTGDHGRPENTIKL